MGIPSRAQLLGLGDIKLEEAVVKPGSKAVYAPAAGGTDHILQHG